MTHHQLPYSAAFQRFLNMEATTHMQWYSQQPLHPDISPQDLFHNLPITYGHFLTHDFVLLPRPNQEASSPQVLMYDLYSDNASLTPLMFPELLDRYLSDRSPTTSNTTIPQWMSAVPTPSSWIEQEDFVPDESEFDGIDAMPDRPFMCQRLERTCSKAFKSLEELHRHEAVAHAVVPTLHEAFQSTRNRVRVHARCGLKPFKCPIPNCDYAAMQRSSVNVHIRTHLPPDRPRGGQLRVPRGSRSTRR
ncbi:hypothetical protein BJ741DRAFT_621083 [Chytriomyces cf. hyalinus JEL632]|nr:hypothetical protein BJ741DRAFT_621083 [Chytriomyces cf. hyalinus JEL632]